MIRFTFTVLLTALTLYAQPLRAQRPGFLTGSVADAASGAPVGYATGLSCGIRRRYMPQRPTPAAASN